MCMNARHKYTFSGALLGCVTRCTGSSSSSRGGGGGGGGGGETNLFFPKDADLTQTLSVSPRIFFSFIF